MRILLTWEDGTIIFRRARKVHCCNGGHDGTQRVRCEKPIRIGDTYIEYVGEVAACTFGYHYHLECAEQQGLIKLI